MNWWWSNNCHGLDFFFVSQPFLFAKCSSFVLCEKILIFNQRKRYYILTELLIGYKLWIYFGLSDTILLLPKVDLGLWARHQPFLLLGWHTNDYKRYLYNTKHPHLSPNKYFPLEYYWDIPIPLPFPPYLGDLGWTIDLSQ